MQTNFEDLSKMKVAATYNNASAYFEEDPLAFWEEYGRRTVELLHLRTGAAVLDVGCGSGASVLHAAQSVGPQGVVIGIDLAAESLERGRRKAAQRHLYNVTFTLGDMTNLSWLERQFDAVVSVFSLFFAPDMVTQLQELWRYIRPGGKLAIASWGSRFFEPAYSIWREIIQTEQPTLCYACTPWDSISAPTSLWELLRRSGALTVKIVSEQRRQWLRTPEDWWTIVLGSGLRGVVDEMSKEAAERVRCANIERVRHHAVTSIETNVLYAIATKGDLSEV
jgi:ubiquinone/menaquinone biosynthesis C-methylase UbiE